MYSIVEKKLDVPINSCWKPIDYTEIPDISASELQGRIDNLWSLEAAADISCFVIYADREHFANVSYFTDYEPRFEETMLFLFRDRKPIIVVGNEGSGFVKKVPYPIDVLLFQPFSLIGQPCETSFDFVELLKKCSIPASGKIGLMGWKKYLNKVFPDKALITDVPHYIVEGLEEVAGKGRLVNSIDLMVDNEYGLRHSVSAEEIIRFEAIGTKVSRNVFNCICNLREGVSEIEASASLNIDGDPINTHPNINFGDKNCSYGLASPTYSTKPANKSQVLLKKFSADILAWQISPV